MDDVPFEMERKEFVLLRVELEELDPAAGDVHLEILGRGPYAQKLRLGREQARRLGLLLCGATERDGG